MQIIYEPHPVSPERKAELRAKGYRIVDARFEPPKPIAEAVEVEKGIVGECGGPEVELPKPKTTRKTK